jgi:phage terminase large subunit-like protein
VTQQNQKLIEAIALIQEKKRRDKFNKFALMFPETGPYSRDKYPKQMDFFASGSKYKERSFQAANRVGKTESGAYEVTCHLTGLYPSWWTGKKFSQPIDAWVAGKTAQTTQEIVQVKLLGKPGEIGSGMIPADMIEGKPPSKPGVPDGINSIRVKHYTNGVYDGDSTLLFKSYDQGRKAFEGTERHVVWFDEEPPHSIYTEALTRTATTKGIILLTFTPLEGLSKTVLDYMPGGKIPDVWEGSKKMVVATWEDVPHLSEEEKKLLRSAYSPYELDARTKGIPQLGSGAIYPIPEDEILVKPFKIPDYWPRAYGFDWGWNRTAAIWVAKDPSDNTLYAYAEYYRAKAEPSIHASAIKARGEWVRGASEWAGVNQSDGEKMLDLYIDEGLKLKKVVKGKGSVEAGILEVWQALSSGRLKIFNTLQNTLAEYRIYRRDEDGKIVDVDDHLMDALRYVITHFDRVALAWSEIEESDDDYDTLDRTRNPVTGY